MFTSGIANVYKQEVCTCAPVLSRFVYPKENYVVCDEIISSHILDHKDTET